MSHIFKVNCRSLVTVLIITLDYKVTSCQAPENRIHYIAENLKQ